MLKCRAIFPHISGIKRFRKAGYIQTVRWITGITPENVPSFDEASLRAAKTFDELPSLKKYPIVGTAWIFLPIIGKYGLKDFNKVILEKQRMFGDIYREKFGPMNIVVTFSAEDLQTIYRHEGPYPFRTELQSLKAYRESRKNWNSTLGIGLLQGKEWYDLRSKIQKHLMKPKAIQAYLNPMQDVARDFVDKILDGRDDNKEMPDLLGELFKWSLESVSLVLLDTRLGCLDANASADSDGIKMIKSIRTAFESMLKLEPFFGNIPFWKLYPTPGWKKFENAFDTFTEIAFKHINRSLEKLKSGNENKDLTLLQSLLLEKGLDSSSAMVMAGDMMMAGIDTTSHSVGYFLYHMAKNPDKQELLYQNIKEILPNKDERITPKEFNELTFLKACIKESQRLNPIVGIHARTLDHDVILSGYRIPAQTVLLGAIEGMSKDARYFSNPSEFLPERWLKKDEKFHPFAFLPFGFGPRSCIGRRLAELEIICLSLEVIRNFRIEYHYEDIDTYMIGINVPDKPLRLNFIER